VDGSAVHAEIDGGSDVVRELVEGTYHRVDGKPSTLQLTMRRPLIGRTISCYD